MSKYLIIIETTDTGYSAYSPDIEGCIAVGDTIEECKANMEEALNFHIEFMLEKGYELPESTSKQADFFIYNDSKSDNEKFALA